MTTDRTLQHLRAINPAPDVERLDIDDNALLLAINDRSADMSTRAEHKKTKRIQDLSDPTPGKRKPAWLVAAAAFAAVLVIAVAIAVLTTRSGDVQPAGTTPPPPSTPATYSADGEGDAVLQFSIPPGPSITSLTHRGTSNFQVMSLDQDLENLVLRVPNRLGEYAGTVPI